MAAREPARLNRRGLLALLGGGAAAAVLPIPAVAKESLAEVITNIQPRLTPLIIGAADVYVSEFGSMMFTLNKISAVYHGRRAGEMTNERVGDDG